MEFCYRSGRGPDPFPSEIGNIHDPTVFSRDNVGEITLIDSPDGTDIYALEHFPDKGEFGNTNRQVSFAIYDAVERSSPGIIFPKAQVEAVFLKKMLVFGYPEEGS